jgi:hypothetical protein
MGGGSGNSSNLLGSVPGMEEENEICPTLTYKQRIIGFVCCFALAIILGIISWISLFNGDIPVFAIIFTCSSLTSVASSLFLTGPMKQLKKMFEESRWIATLVFLVSMVMTLISAFVIKIPALCVVFCIIQYLAMLWYTISFIPFARTAVKNIAASICCRGGAN